VTYAGQAQPSWQVLPPYIVRTMSYAKFPDSRLNMHDRGMATCNTVSPVITLSISTMAEMRDREEKEGKRERGKEGKRERGKEREMT
jgi:hypothetical protein